MLSLVRRIFGGPKGTDNEREAIVDYAIEKALDVSDPRLRAISGYKRKLRPSARVAVDFVLEAVRALPPALEMSPERFGTDPQVRAFFGSAAQMRELFSADRDVRSFLSRSENASLTHFYAGMRMRLEEKRVLAQQMSGDTVQREVLRTAMNFGDHRIVLPNRDEKGVRNDLQERVFVGLIESALEQFGESIERKEHLKELRALLKTKLASLHAVGAGLESLSDAESGSGVAIEEVQNKLRAVEEEIKRRSLGSNTLADYLAQLDYVLGHPGDFVRLEPRSARITRMGFKTDPEATEPGDDVSYLVLVLKSEEIVATLVKFPRDALLAEKTWSNVNIL